MTSIIYLNEIDADRSDHCRLDLCDEGISRGKVDSMTDR
jgi:hypothetical protein